MSERKSVRRDAPRPGAAPKPGAARPRRAQTLTAAWASLVFALLVVVFFHEVSLGGKTFVSPDATAPAGFVRMGEQSLWKDHVYPLWNPYVFLGMPSFGSGAYNPLIYPPDWPVALLQKALPLPDLTWMLIYYWLGAFGVFLLAREWGARAEAAVLAGAAFVFAPNLVAVGSHGHGSQLVNSMYLPVMVWLATRWLRRGGLHHLGWLALAGGFQMLRGHVQICFYTWMAIGLYAAVEWIAAWREPAKLGALTARVAAIGGAAALAFGIAGFFNLPLRDYAQYSIRGGGEGGGVGMPYATQWSFSFVELPSVLVPSWAGFGGQLYWGGMPFTDYPNAYLGVVAVALAVPAFLAGGVPRVFALLLAALSIFVAFGRNFPLYGVLYDHLPLFNKFRIPVMIVLLFQLAAALGLAWGWSAAIETPAKLATGGKDKVARALFLTGAVLAAALVIGVLGQSAWESGYVALATHSKPDYPADAARFAYHAWVQDLGRAALVGLCAVALAWFARRGRLPAPLASVGVLALLLIELWPVSGRVMKPVIGPVADRSVEAGRDDVVQFLEQAAPPASFRILPTADLQSNRFAGFGIATVGGYHAAKPRLVQNFLGAQLSTNVGWMRLLNVRFILTAQPLDPPPPFLREVYRGSQIVYENLLALPRATVVGAYQVVEPDTAILDRVASLTTDAANVTFLVKDPKLALGPVAGATAQVTSYRLNDVTVKVATPGPGLLRLADAWYPDWTATVDGKRTEVLRADYLLRAVAVPAGTHEVVFRFESKSIRQGLTLSLVSAGLALLLLGVGLVRSRRPRGGPAPGPAPAEEGSA